MQELTLRIVAKCLFDVDLIRQIDEFVQAFTSMFGYPVGLLEALFNSRIDLPITAYGKRMDAKRRVDTFINELIVQRRTKERDTNDLLSLLPATQEWEDKITDMHLQDLIMTFLAAGHGTIANALTWTFYLLSEYPEARKKLLNELQDALAGRVPTTDDLRNLPYLEWVLNESLRLYPPVWRHMRRSIDAFSLDDTRFPASTTVMLCQWITHRLPEIWEFPDSFQPERWSPSNYHTPTFYTSHNTKIPDQIEPTHHFESKKWSSYERSTARVKHCSHYLRQSRRSAEGNACQCAYSFNRGTSTSTKTYVTLQPWRCRRV